MVSASKMMSLDRGLDKTKHLNLSAGTFGLQIFFSNVGEHVWSMQMPTNVLILSFDGNIIIPYSCGYHSHNIYQKQQKMYFYGCFLSKNTSNPASQLCFSLPSVTVNWIYLGFKKLFGQNNQNHSGRFLCYLTFYRANASLTDGRLTKIIVGCSPTLVYRNEIQVKSSRPTVQRPKIFS